MPVTVSVFTSNGVWVKPPRLRAVDVIVRAGGGRGNGSIGGGGGSALEQTGVITYDVADVVNVIVGRGGTTSSPDGGDSDFDGLICKGGKGAANGGAGGYGPFRGGNGTSGVGQSVTMQPISLIAGGAGGGATGGVSGMDLRKTTGGLLWPEYIGSGRGGGTNQAGEYPAGGGGKNGNGAAGVVVVIEYLVEVDLPTGGTP